MGTITSSCITAVVTLIICIIKNQEQQTEARQQQDETRKLLEYKLDAFTKRVDKHNNLRDKTYSI